MSPENLEPRVTALERQVRDLRSEVQANKLDVTTTQALVVAVDRDLGEMQNFRQAATASFNAMRADMVDMRQDITDLRTDMVDMRTDITDLRTDMVDMRQDITDLRTDMTELRTEVRTDITDLRTEMNAKFDVTAAGQQRIVEMIQTVIDAQGDNAAS